MKCPNCQVEMEEGFFSQGTWSPTTNRVSNHVIRASKKALPILHSLHGAEFVTAWRCPKCGKVELYVEV